ncbi:MAG: flagellar filament capping protein FliD, partial [bacterium]
TAQRTKYDKLYQKKQKAQWKKDAYLELNTQISSLRNKVFDLKLQSNFNLKKTTPSNASAVTINAGSQAVNGNMEMSIEKLAKGAYLTSKKDSLADVADGKFTKDLTLKINGNDIEVKAGDSASDVAKRINSEKIGITASYDAGTNRFFFTTTSSGYEAKIELDKDTALALGMGTSDVTVKGQDAKFKLNGAEFTQASNNFTINGMTFNLKETTVTKDVDGNIIDEGTFSIVTETDVDGIYDQIKGFVDEYNKLISAINTKTKEKVDRDYSPLTETQKEDMSEDEIKKWEEKAKQGILRNDSILSKVATSMRTALSSSVTLSDGSKLSIYNIGFDTGSYTTNGQISIDEDKLKAAIASDPDKIIEFFTANGKDDSAQNGIFQRLQESLDTAMSDISDEAGKSSATDQSVLGKRLTSLQEAMDKEKERLKALEKKYYAQFSTMETYISKMMSQMSMFTNYTS